MKQTMKTKGTKPNKSARGRLSSAEPPRQRRAEARRRRPAGPRISKLTVMQIRVITMRYSEGVQGFSEDALRSATFGREVLAVGGNPRQVSDGGNWWNAWVVVR